MRKTILVANDDEDHRKRLMDLLQPEYNTLVVDNAIDTINTYLGIDCERPAIDGIVLQAEKYDKTALNGRQDIISCGVAAMELRGHGFTGPIVIRYDIADKLDERIQRYLNGRVQDEAYLIGVDEDDKKLVDYLKSQFE